MNYLNLEKKEEKSFLKKILDIYKEQYPALFDEIQKFN